MTHDQNKKTLRQFQCRDYLWEIFEQMSAELECSVDYLINESMRQYARSRNYGVRGPGAGARSTPGPIPQARPPQIPSAPPPPPMRTGPSFPGGSGFASPPHGGYSTPASYRPPPASPRSSSPPYAGAAPSYAPAPAHASAYPPPPPTHRPPPPTPGYGAALGPSSSAPGYAAPAPAAQTEPSPLPGGVAAPSGAPPTLYVIFNGQKFPVQKEEFIIGRGSKTADLPIKDGNISRRHAAVIWQNGAWYMKDLGSTNGVEFQGRKVDSKRVEEGDVYHLCDYEIRFTYR
jgi:hypothetical protein